MGGGGGGEKYIEGVEGETEIEEGNPSPESTRLLLPRDERDCHGQNGYLVFLYSFSTTSSF